MDTLLQDLRYGIRVLRKNPGFAFIAIITLTLGIGANVIIFTFLDAALLKPLPYKEPARLTHLYDTRAMEVNARFEASYPDYLDWKQQTKSYESLAGYSGPRPTTYKGASTPERILSGYVTDNFFSTLGITPLLGRDFQSGEEAASAPRNAILSYSTWQNRFGARKDVLGTTMVLDDKVTTIVGVLPANFHFAPIGSPDLWVTLHATDGLANRRNLHWLNIVGRLKDGVSLQSAATEMNLIAQRLEAAYPQTNHDLRTATVPLNDVIVGEVRPILLVLLATVGLLLLIACSNVANLLLARSESRRKEIAVRTAIGAGKWRIIRQLLTEGLLLSVLSAAIGLGLALWAVRIAPHLIQQEMLSRAPFLMDLGLDLQIVIFTCAVSMITGVLFTMVPALQLLNSDVQASLKSEIRSPQSRSWKNFSSGLVVSELAVTLVLLVGAGLLIKSVYRLLQVDPGYKPDHLLTLSVSFPSEYNDSAKAIAIHREVLSNIAALPGVISVGDTDILPLNGGNTIMFQVVGHPTAAPEGNEANIRTASTGYFETLQAKLVEGRFFNEGDNPSAPPRLMVNQTFAKLYMDGQAVGKNIVFTFSPKEKPREIVGVVADVKEGPLDAAAHPAVYTTFNQDASPGFSLVVRTAQDPMLLEQTITNSLRQLNRDTLVYAVRPMQELIDQSPTAYLHRYPAWLAGGFAAIAFVLGAIGLYGVISYSVSQRTKEIGVRMALGAQRNDILRLVLVEGTRLVGFGVGFGIIGAIATAYLLRSMLFGVKAWDLSTLAVVTGTLASVALVASFIPARRATQVDPLVAIRHE